MDTGGSLHNGVDRHPKYDQPAVEHKGPLQPAYKIFDIDVAKMAESDVRDLFILKFNDFVNPDGYKSTKPSDIQQGQLCVELSQPDQLVDSNKYLFRTKYFQLTCILDLNGDAHLREYQSAAEHIWIDESAPDNFYKQDSQREYQFTTHVIDESRYIRTLLFHDSCILDGNDFKTDSITFTRKGPKGKVLITLNELASIDVIDQYGVRTSCASCVSIDEINRGLAKFELQFEESIQEIRNLCAEKWQKIQRPHAVYEAWPAMQTSE